ncbi:ABC-2 type transport system permease protein [Catalinimonas alkaloidigena]|uniref:ABC-2 type transport system permease protein n=1 Tax=Catalinimonas alkaloidigena TaxID=1075417 RepID=A0A1G9VEE9_9BACT|nr:DUF3526 domain-containing protein [Catalinimonas alkaloidigena]SDM70235.1 ABC-2 type transport system permease protein [Catalinimonas alkaloidigena]
MFPLLFRNFLRATGVQIGLVLLFLLGLLSLYNGRQFLDRQAYQRREVVASQQEDLQRQLQFHPDDLGDVLYYVRFAFVNDTPPLAGLSLGQRDLHPSIQRVTIRTLEAQKYDADLQNPMHLLLGSLDFSFVVIYLFPLLIIAFTYHLISEERENGTWRLVAVQSRRLLGFVAQLFLVRAAVVIGLLLVLLLLALPWLDIPLDLLFLAFTALAVLYVLGWFGLSFWVASLYRDSRTNAAWLVSLWVLLLILLPAAANQWILMRSPLPDALETTLEQRKGYHEKWDFPQGVTMTKFYARYPQFKKYPLADTTAFNWPWYYAMQHMGDEAAATTSDAFQQKVTQRLKDSQQLSWWIPPLHTQFYLTALARTGLDNQLRFLENTTQFHERLRLFFYPQLFTNQSTNSVRWEELPVETFVDRAPLAYGAMFLPPLLFLLAGIGLGVLNFQRHRYSL